jgi:hypothetical protein
MQLISMSTLYSSVNCIRRSVLKSAADVWPNDNHSCSRLTTPRVRNSARTVNCINEDFRHFLQSLQLSGRPKGTLNSATTSFSCSICQIKIRNTTTVRSLTNCAPEKVSVNTFKIKCNETKLLSRSLSELRKFIDMHENVGLCQTNRDVFQAGKGLLKPIIIY